MSRLIGGAGAQSTGLVSESAWRSGSAPISPGCEPFHPSMAPAHAASFGPHDRRPVSRFLMLPPRRSMPRCRPTARGASNWGWRAGRRLAAGLGACPARDGVRSLDQLDTLPWTRARPSALPQPSLRVVVRHVPLGLRACPDARDELVPKHESVGGEAFAPVACRGYLSRDLGTSSFRVFARAAGLLARRAPICSAATSRQSPSICEGPPEAVGFYARSAAFSEQHSSIR